MNLINKKKKNSNRKKGQAKNDIIDNKTKLKDREKRIKERNKEHVSDEFDIETEKLIQMTNKNRIRKEEQKRKQNTIKEKKRKKRNKRIKIFLKVFVFIILITGSVVFALTSPLFNIKEINVINNSQISSETIISLSEIKLEENIFKFSKNKVENKIKENPYVESVKIERKVPGTVEINVEERIPKFSVDFMGKYMYINSQGYFLELSDENKNLPIIYGVTTIDDEIIPGNRLNNEDLNRLEDVMKIINSANENSLEGQVTGIDISDKNDYTMYLEEKGKKIHLGNTSNLSNKMLYILAIIEQEDGKEGEIFVNGDLNNKFQPYFREKV